MKITYYGTAAGEGWPGVFCYCEPCQKARQLGGKNIRTRSQALVNDDLLLDITPDTNLHSLFYGLDLSRVRYLLVTHSHNDHCLGAEMELLKEPYSHTCKGIEVWGNDRVREKIIRATGNDGGEKERFRYHEAEPNHPIAMGDYTVTPLRASHDRTEACLIYHIAQGDKSILYAHDTGTLTQENIDCLLKQPQPLSLVSLDCTMMRERDGYYHMGLPDAAEQREKLLRLGLADERTIWVVNHFSHNGGWLHDQLCEEAAKYGFIASYDTMTLTF